MYEEITAPNASRPAMLFVGVDEDFTTACRVHLGALPFLRAPDDQTALDLLASLRPLVIAIGPAAEGTALLREVARDVRAEIVAVRAGGDPAAVGGEVLDAAYRADRARRTNAPDPVAAKAPPDPPAFRAPVTATRRRFPLPKG